MRLQVAFDLSFVVSLSCSRVDEHTWEGLPPR